MKREHLIRIVVLAAVALLVAWIAQHTYWKEIKIPTALQGDAATNPFYSIEKLASSLGVKAERRYTLGTLPTNAVVVLADWNWSLIASRRQRLEQFVNAGGRLVLDASLNGGQADIEKWAGIKLQQVKYRKTDDDEPEADDEDESDDDCKDLLITGRAVVSTHNNYRVCGLFSSRRLISSSPLSWGLSDTNGLQALRVEVGRGSVGMILAQPFSNRALLMADHGLVFAAMAQLHRGDVVYLIAEQEQASLLSLIWRDGAPVVMVMLLMLVLILWRDGVRFGPLQATLAPARRSLAEQISGTGQFILQVGGGRALHAAAVRALHEAASRRIAHYQQLSASDKVAAIRRLTQQDFTDLEHAVNYAGPRSAAEFRHTLALLETTRRRLLNIDNSLTGHRACHQTIASLRWSPKRRQARREE